jgi:hypothetical protein
VGHRPGHTVRVRPGHPRSRPPQPVVAVLAITGRSGSRPEISSIMVLGRHRQADRLAGGDGHARDATQVGTSEVQRMIIARELGLSREGG